MCMPMANPMTTITTLVPSQSSLLQPGALEGLMMRRQLAMLTQAHRLPPVAL